MCQGGYEPDEISVSPDMIAAGVDAYFDIDVEDEGSVLVVTKIFRAMRSVELGHDLSRLKQEPAQPL